MTLTVGTSGGNKTISALTVGTASGNKSVIVGYVGTSGGNKVFFSPGTITTFNYNLETTDTGSCSALYTLSSTGTILAIDNGVSYDIGEWVSPITAAGDSFEARATATLSEGATTGTFGSWLPLGTDRTWGPIRFSPGEAQVTFTLEIRRASDSVVLKTNTISLRTAAF